MAATYRSLGITNKLPSRTGQIFSNSTHTGFSITAAPNGAYNIFHVLHGIYTNIMSTPPNKQDLTIIVPLNLHNTFIAVQHGKHILQHFASACPTVLKDENSKASHEWDILRLWKHIQAHHGMTGPGRTRNPPRLTVLTHQIRVRLWSGNRKL